jgi:hypothetical protein
MAIATAALPAIAHPHMSSAPAFFASHTTPELCKQAGVCVVGRTVSLDPQDSHLLTDRMHGDVPNIFKEASHDPGPTWPALNSSGLRELFRKARTDVGEGNRHLFRLVLPLRPLLHRSAFHLRAFGLLLEFRHNVITAHDQDKGVNRRKAKSATNPGVTSSNLAVSDSTSSSARFTISIGFYVLLNIMRVRTTFTLR